MDLTTQVIVKNGIQNLLFQAQMGQLTSSNVQTQAQVQDQAFQNGVFQPEPPQSFMHMLNSRGNWFQPK